MRDPEGVGEPPAAVVLLLQPVVGGPQQPGVFFVQTLPPKAVKDSPLLP